jgi:hypothetical protein
MMRRKADPLAVLCAVLCGLAFLVTAAIATLVVDQNGKVNGQTAKLNDTIHKLNRTVVRLEQASLGVCMRLQRQRERSNLSDARQFLILRQVLESPRLMPEARVTYQSYVDSAEYGPPTDCREAVDDPPSYRAPPFIPFSAMGKRGPVFAQALIDAAKRREPPPVYRP